MTLREGKKAASCGLFLIEEEKILIAAALYFMISCWKSEIMERNGYK